MTLPAGIRVVWREVPHGIPRREVSRALLAELLPGARFVSRCPACGGDHGRVRAEGADAAVSVSYVPGWAVVAVAHRVERIGVDAVPRDAAGLERVLPGAAGAVEWARAEAVLKADGRGLIVDPRRVAVTAYGEGPAAVRPFSGGPVAVTAYREGPTAVTAYREGPTAITGHGKGPAAGMPPGESWHARIDGAAGDEALSWRGWDLDGPAGVVVAVAVPADTLAVKAREG